MADNKKQYLDLHIKNMMHLKNAKKVITTEDVVTSLYSRGQTMIYQNQNARDLILFSTITTEISISLRIKCIYVLK